MTDLQHETVRETTPAEQHRSALTWWLAGALVVALAAVVGLGAWTWYDHSQTSTSPPAASGLATDAVTTLLASRVAAVNNGDKQALMNVYASDAVVEERDQNPPVIYSGNEQIATILTGYHSMGWSLHQTGVAIHQGRYVSEPLEWSGGSGIAVYEIDDQGLIAHQWVIGE